MARITVVFDADLINDNAYTDGGCIADSIRDDDIPEGTGVYIQLGSGDMVRGKLVSIDADMKGGA
jgi:hypothetical protein